ncbi:MAG: gliding motility-associated C-terminal domain-containing protein [Bacteroidota bacterium]
MINQGSIRLEGDWVNQSSYSGSGSVALVGNGEQLIQHSEQSFGTLKVENAGLKVLENGILINDTLTLSEGVIVSTRTHLLQLGAEAIVENASNLSYVQGPVQFEGTGYQNLPLGTANVFSPLELLDVQGVDPVILAEVIDNASFLVSGERLEEKPSSKYWKLELISGNFDGSIAGLPVNFDDGFDDMLGIVVAQSEDLNGEFANLGQNERRGGTDNGYVSSEVIATGPVLALGLTADYSVENSVEIPSAFAPDASNPIDRQIRVYAANLLTEGFSFTVFNRWGQIVYQTTVLNDARTVGWDGVDVNTNQAAPAGVYSYVLQGRYETNGVVEKTGSITLFR